MRRDVTVLGKFGLNITNIPHVLKHAPLVDEKQKKTKNFADCFFEALKQFISMGHMFKLTIDNLNKSNLIPNKDYNKDKLVSGMLQLPEQFQLVIDETELSSGELKEKGKYFINLINKHVSCLIKYQFQGLMNINSIKEIIKWQKMNYDFSFHQQEFNTNIRVLVLSETKSLLPFDVQLKLNPNVQYFEAEKYEAFINQLFVDSNSGLLNNMRKYFSILSHLDYKLTQPMQQLVEDDIVQIRQSPKGNTNNKMCIEDFHLLLVVAR